MSGEKVTIGLVLWFVGGYRPRFTRPRFGHSRGECLSVPRSKLRLNIFFVCWRGLGSAKPQKGRASTIEEAFFG